MKITKNTYGEYIIEEVVGGAYSETQPAQPSGRLLDGSRDHGHDQEYIGYGAINGIPVQAVYLLDQEDYDCDDEGTPNEDAGNWDWDAALLQGRLVVDVDKLTAREMAILMLLCG